MLGPRHKQGVKCGRIMRFNTPRTGVVFTFVTERGRKVELVNWPTKAVHRFNEPRPLESMRLTQFDAAKAN